jgi:hypothetical protein
MSKKEQIHIYVDAELTEELEKYADKLNMSKSALARALIHQGLTDLKHGSGLQLTLK